MQTILSAFSQKDELSTALCRIYLDEIREVCKAYSMPKVESELRLGAHQALHSVRCPSELGWLMGPPWSGIHISRSGWPTLSHICNAGKEMANRRYRRWIIATSVYGKCSKGEQSQARHHGRWPFLCPFVLRLLLPAAD